METPEAAGGPPAASTSFTAQLAVPRPTAERERIEAIDVLRGLVLLGILLINIEGFGLPHWVFENPTVAGGHTGINWWAWFGATILVEGKMRALFSMLFGAGVILMTQRAEGSGPEGRAQSADIYYRRMLWLGAFGIFDAYLLVWPGDILYAYAAAGLLLFPFRRLRARTLLIAGFCLILAQAGYSVCARQMRIEHKNEIAAIQVDKEAGKELTEEQKEKLEGWEEKLEERVPPARKVEAEIKTRRGGYLENVVELAGFSKKLQSGPLYMSTDILSMMLLGMALLRADVINGRRGERFYKVMALVCLPLCWVIAALTPLVWSRSGFDPMYIAPWWAASAWTYPAQRLLGALGYLSAVMLLARSARVRRITSAIASAGRIPLTNYLGQSIICLFIFTGVGLAMFAKLDRYQLLFLAVAIWVVQVLVSVLWFRWFEFGPTEWLWRWLSYGKRPKMLRE